MKANETVILDREQISRLIDALDYQRWNDRELSNDSIKTNDRLLSILKQKEEDLVYGN
mgnify:CR=1 FL=1